MTDAVSGRPPIAAEMPGWITLLLAVTCGLIAANLYYAQPLVGPISVDLGLSTSAAGLIVTMSQVGYAAGLLLIVPLGDLIENRKLVLGTIALAFVAILIAGMARTPAPFLGAMLLIGLGSVAVQILVPYAAHIAPEASRGRVVGNVLSGLLLGIMLARPAASFLAAVASWHAIFFVSAGLMVVLWVVLWRLLPVREAHSKLGYGALLRSMAHLAMTTPVLQRRAAYQCLLFGAFSVFWTTSPLYLAETFGLGQSGIALFALAGAAGAVATPICGHLADHGWSKIATGAAILSVGVSFLITHLAPAGSTLALGLMVLAAIALDFGVSGNLVLGQRAIFALGHETRARMNGFFMAVFFLGGAAGSALGAWAYAHGGWLLASGVGTAFTAAALVLYVTEWRRSGVAAG